MAGTKIVGEPSRGGKWEEEIYWTRFHTLCFVQLLFEGFDEQLTIPQKFTSNLRETLPERVTLKGPSGVKWEVGIVRIQDTFFFKQGWKKFVQDNSLQEDDVLVFKYSRSPCIDVSIFDGSNFCEREASYFVRKSTEPKECGDGISSLKRNMRESSVDQISDDDDDDDDHTDPDYTHYRLNMGLFSSKKSGKASGTRLRSASGKGKK